MAELIDLVVSPNNIDTTVSINDLVVLLEQNMLEVVNITQSVDVANVRNYLEFLTNNTELVVQNIGTFLEVTQAAASIIEVTDETNTLEVISTFLGEVQLTTQQLIIEINNDPPNTDVDEAEVMYKKRTDFVSDTLIYKGVAAPGALETAAVWRISRITFDPNSNDDIAEDFVNGTDGFLNIWDDRATLNYG
jgi:hypothetical protein